MACEWQVRESEVQVPSRHAGAGTAAGSSVTRQRLLGCFIVSTYITENNTHSGRGRCSKKFVGGQKKRQTVR